MNDFGIIVAILFAAFLVFCVGLTVGLNSQITEVKKEAINHGYAHHNPKTGEWEWMPKDK